MFQPRQTSRGVLIGNFLSLAPSLSLVLVDSEGNYEYNHLLDSYLHFHFAVKLNVRKLYSSLVKVK